MVKANNNRIIIEIIMVALMAIVITITKEATIVVPEETEVATDTTAMKTTVIKIRVLRKEVILVVDKIIGKMRGSSRVLAKTIMVVGKGIRDLVVIMAATVEETIGQTIIIRIMGNKAVDLTPKMLARLLGEHRKTPIRDKNLMIMKMKGTTGGIIILPCKIIVITKRVAPGDQEVQPRRKLMIVNYKIILAGTKKMMVKMLPIMVLMIRIKTLLLIGLKMYNSSNRI